MQTIQISGITCEACVKLISKKLSSIPEVTSVSGNKTGIFRINVTRPLKPSHYTRALEGSSYQLISIN